MEITVKGGTGYGSQMDEEARVRHSEEFQLLEQMLFDRCTAW